MSMYDEWLVRSRRNRLCMKTESRITQNVSEYLGKCHLQLRYSIPVPDNQLSGSDQFPGHAARVS